MKREQKSLTLKKRVVRTLSEGELVQAQGGLPQLPLSITVILGPTSHIYSRCTICPDDCPDSQIA